MHHEKFFFPVEVSSQNVEENNCKKDKKSEKINKNSTVCCIDNTDGNDGNDASSDIQAEGEMIKGEKANSARIFNKEEKEEKLEYSEKKEKVAKGVDICCDDATKKGDGRCEEDEGGCEEGGDDCEEDCGCNEDDKTVDSGRGDEEDLYTRSLKSIISKVCWWRLSA